MPLPATVKRPDFIDRLRQAQLHGQDSHVNEYGQALLGSQATARRTLAARRSRQPTGPGKDTSVDRSVGQAAPGASRHQTIERSIVVGVRPYERWPLSIDYRSGVIGSVKVTRAATRI
jgi:hypothetical protein